MEAIGVGANVLAFVLLGLKSAKFIHETLSAVKDGPEIVQRVARDILQLHWILERVHQSRAAADDESLLFHAQQCVDDLGSLAEIVQRLQLATNERLTGRFWKRIKTVLSEKDLARISTQVTQKASLLDFRINLLSSDATFEIKDGQDQLMQTTQALDSSIQNQFNSLTERFVQMEDALSSKLADRKPHLPVGPPEHTQAAEPISVKDIGDMLQQIRDHIVASPTQSISGPVTGQGTTDGLLNSQVEPPRVDQQMMNSLDRLCRLIDEKRRTIDAYSEDDELAESIMEDLQQIVNSLQQHGAPVERSEDGLLETKELELVSFRNGLRRFARGFGGGILEINGRNNGKAKYSPGTRIQQSRTLDHTDIGVGKLSFLIHKRKRSIQENLENSRKIQKRGGTDYSMSLTFLPKKSSYQPMIVASSFQHQTADEGILTFSTLMVNRVLPAGSLVFKLAREGNLQELQEMFRNREASPRDHDEHGASLLHYSTTQPEVCKFLIACGLDPDHVANTAGVEGGQGYFVSLLQFELNDDEMDGEELVRVNQCRKLLLEAGGDPTLNLTNEGESVSYLGNSIATGTCESLRIAWNSELTGHIANATSYKINGQSAFLAHCRNLACTMTTESIKLFLALGADIRDRDENGFTCLHMCFLERSYLKDPHEEFNAVKFLVESGADPSSRTYLGASVSDFAYCRTKEKGSYDGDLWDAVLQSCSFDISQFRSHSHRRYAKYTMQYSREDFEALWEGRESECPYWDDEPWPPLEPGEIDYGYGGCSEDDSERMDCEGDESDSQVEISSDGLREWEGTMELGGRTLCDQCWKKCHGLENVEEDTSGDSESESDGQESPRMESHCEEQLNQGDITYQQADARGEMPHFSPLSDMELDNPWID
ncbi:hypothetical protein BGZ61DRAFT_453250 [Ilyonectria robusta]|uniref:uncharacterized protein n=1 Tax=Ilyonectria robusta TaxID=1079257 RepID=UPI001E8DFF22|nr:uncharacterized protein BGZ61DRAFT_453250 [Ilyonectria robusta]KAH8688464.1 hypothetical protein BGZ61DRAFT_453250 [Ilyonectria robusta]